MSVFTTVITTIQDPTPSVQALERRLKKEDSNLLVIGDKKGPAEFKSFNSEFYPLKAQLDLPFKLASILPVSHYARKNIGYLLAFSKKATLIYETDDDNAPRDNWLVRKLQTNAQKISPRPWANVYRLFTDDLIWPRGFPLRLVSDPVTYSHDIELPVEIVEAPIQQGLADLSPDVDALWRMLLDHEFCFPSDQQSVWLPPGTWCPFNSQNTWWWPTVYPLMYLPAFCSFRMTDIWRSLIAQRCLWELDLGVVFHAADVVQERNDHNLMIDFEQELPGYINNESITLTLSDLSLSAGKDSISSNLMRCYEALVVNGFMPEEELPSVKAWLTDIENTMI